MATDEENLQRYIDEASKKMSEAEEAIREKSELLEVKKKKLEKIKEIAAAKLKAEKTNKAKNQEKLGESNIENKNEDLKDIKLAYIKAHKQVKEVSSLLFIAFLLLGTITPFVLGKPVLLLIWILAALVFSPAILNGNVVLTLFSLIIGISILSSANAPFWFVLIPIGAFFAQFGYTRLAEKILKKKLERSDPEKFKQLNEMESKIRAAKEKNKRMRKESTSNKEVFGVFEKVNQLLTNEKLQNEGLPSIFMSMLKDNIPEREVSEYYGVRQDDPIRVNGSLGELIYISMLRTVGGEGFIGHRLGSLNQLDVYEVCTEDFQDWRILYFDMYWLQKDRRSPEGLLLDLEDTPVLSATQKFSAKFPIGFWEDLLETTTQCIGIAAVRTTIKGINLSLASRPKEHSYLLEKTLVEVRAEGIGEDG